MQFLRKQMASTLAEAAKDGIKKLDKDSPIIRELKDVDVDSVLEHDIHKICQGVTFSEMTKIMALAMKARGANIDDECLKQEVKLAAREIIDRIEKQSGKLKVPEACRELLFNL